MRYNNIFFLASGNPSLSKKYLMRSSFLSMVLIADDTKFRSVFILAIILADISISFLVFSRMV